MTTSAQTRPERRSALPPSLPPRGLSRIQGRGIFVKRYQPPSLGWARFFGYRSITVSAGRFPTAPEPRA